jgi:hypothetical protein
MREGRGNYFLKILNPHLKNMSTETMLKSIIALMMIAVSLGYFGYLLYSSEQDFAKWNKTP